MPRFLIEASYKPEGVKGLIKEGVSHRRDFVRGLIERAGGKMESFDFAFGANDLYIICELPDTTSALSLSLAVNSSGAVGLRVVPLVSVEEMEAAAKRQVGYRLPGTG
jgi:uncharacterized protein with GYD domain